MTRFPRLVALVAVGLAALGCDLLTGTKDGSFVLSLDEVTLNIGQSGSDTIVVSLLRSDYNKPVVLDVDGEPAGMIVSLSPKTVPGNVSSSQLRITMTGTAAPGTATLVLRANGDGVPERTEEIDITVGVTGNFTVGTLDGPAVAAQGGGAIVTVVVPRTGGHADSVALSVEGLPSGVAATFSSAKTTASASSLRLSVAGDVAVGSYPLTVTANAPALTAQTSPLTLTVTAPPATALLSIPFCASHTPVWLAYQNEGYQWQSVAGSNGVFSFEATERLLIAYVYVVQTSGFNYTHLIADRATRAEFALQSTRRCDGAKSVSGSVSGVGFGQNVRVAMGGAAVNATAAAPSFSMTNVPDKVVDLFATRGTFSSSADGDVLVTPDKWIVRRGLNPPNAASLPALDFSVEAFDPFQSVLTIGNGVAGDQFIVTVGLGSPTGTFGLTTGSHSSATSRPVFSVPANQLVAGEVLELTVEARQGQFASGRFSVQYLDSLGDRTENLPAPLSIPSASVFAEAPHLRVQGTIPVQADFPSRARFITYYENETNSSAPVRYFDMLISKDYLGATPGTSWMLVNPDLSSAPGFSQTWVPPSITGYQADAFGGPVPLLWGAMPVAGESYKQAYYFAPWDDGAGISQMLRGAGSARPPARLQYLRR